MGLVVLDSKENTSGCVGVGELLCYMLYILVNAIQEV